MKKLYRAFFLCRHKSPCTSNGACPAEGGIYENQPNGNLVGDLPAGARAQTDSGTLTRKDGGDPFERAIFITPSGRTVIVERQS